MNLSTVVPIPDVSSLSAILFASNPAIAAINTTGTGLGQQGGVRQDPPVGSRGIRRDEAPKAPPAEPSDVDDEKSSSSEEE